MPRSCDIDPATGQRIGVSVFPQTLFLGASVISYSVNMGWGGQPSSLSVELINDGTATECLAEDGITPAVQLFTPRDYPDNHYYDCVGDDCYVDERGRPYNENNIPAPLQRKIPGKVYYVWTPDKGMVSRYWFDEDPGFFGDFTKIDVSSTYRRSGFFTSYDIIGVPVVFILDDFIFGGIVQSWEKNIRSNLPTYTVVVEGPDSLLNNSFLILKDYAGSVFTKLNSGSNYGGPLSYIGPEVPNAGKIQQGNLHNVFNIYGFLESMAIDSFGGASVTEEGISYSAVLDALSVLTSCVDTNQLENLDKDAFSPFGRILGKVLQENGSYIRPQIGLGFGTINPTIDPKAGNGNVERNFFTLDLSELPRPPESFRVSGDVISIMDFIRNLTSIVGKDFFTELIPGRVNGKAYNIIKVKVVDRTSQPAQNQISSTVSALGAAGYSVEVNGIGQELNDSSSPRVLYIGGKQERLLQVKNYRLGFKQTAYIYNPAIDRLVDFREFNGKNHAGKIRQPVAYSVRNPDISRTVNGDFASQVFDQAEEIHRRLNQVKFPDNDALWVDTDVGGNDQVRAGNYAKCSEVTAWGDKPTNRYIPIYMDTICPFFGYALEDKIEISTDTGSNNFRKIRPVWLDSWTGQINVVCSVGELPPVTMGTSSFLRTASIPSFLNNGYFLISETEMRAAMSGLDSYLTYCHAKSVATKPQLYMMLMSAYYYANPAFANVNGEISSDGYGGSFVRTIVGVPIPFLPPENVFVHQANQANNNGLPQDAPAQAGEPENKLARSAFIDPNFIKDLSSLCEFVASLGNKFYGQKYMVRIGDIPGYRDRTYADIEIPGGIHQGEQGEPISVFSGTGKIFFSRETCESAWEEPGNVIDDSFVVGSEAWYALINEQGKIPPLLGYNASDSFDWEARRVCGLRVIANSFRYTERSTMRLLVAQAANTGAAGGAVPEGAEGPQPRGFDQFAQQMSSYLTTWGGAGSNEVLQFDTSYGNMVRFFLTAQGVCSDDKFIFPSLNLGNLSKNDFVLMGTRGPREDAYGKTISAGQPPPNFTPPVLTPQLTLKPFTNPGGMAKKLFLKSQVEGIGFMDPINLKDTRAILSCPGIKLNPPSLNFAIDPTRTVVCNAALEDLIVYLKMTPGNNPNQYNQIYVDRLLSLIRGYDLFTTTYTDPQTGAPVIGPQSRQQLFPNMGYNTNVSKDHATVVAKAAHPYFAAVPIRSNQYCYGPWTNYPKLISDQIFLPGVLAQIQNYTNQLESLGRMLGKLNPLSSTYENDRKYLNREIRIITLLLQRFSAGLNSVRTGDAVENLLGAVKVEVDQDLVPWNYGGMAFLDKAVIGLMNSNTDFQQILETAQISINAAPIFGIGGEFTFKNRVRLTGNKFRYNNEEYESKVETLTYIDTKKNPAGPAQSFPIPGTIVYLPPTNSNLVTNTLTYSVLSIKSLNRTGIAPIITNMSTRFDNSGFNTTYSFKTYARKLGLFSKQNSDRLKKAAENNIKFNKNLFSLKNSIITGNIAQTQSRFIDNRDESSSLYSVGNLQSKLFGTSPTEVLIGSAQGFLPSKGSMQAQLRMSFPVINRTDNSMTLPTVTPLKITGKDLGDLPVNYNDIKSVMSKYRFRSWVGMYQQWETKTELEEGYDEKSAMSLDGLFSPVSFYPTLSNSTYAILPYPKINGTPICPRCRGDKKIDDTYAIGENPRSAGIHKYACPACSKGMPAIVVDKNSVSGVNALNLQPLVVPYNIWRNAHAQPPASGERQRHSIRVVARNWTPPFDPGNGISLDTDKNKEIFKNPSNNKFVEDGNGFNIDFHPNDMTKFAQNGGYYPNNQRFFAWRGPLMMHGWGYDISGFPVPNAADEPKEIDTHGRPKRFRLTSSGTNDYSQEGLFDPSSSQYGLGDIMGKGWERVDGVFTRKPSQYFYLNWAERPDLWPVGPIDLRWDYEKRVWVGGGQGGDCTGNELPPFIIADTNDPELLSKFTTLPKGKCAYKSVYVTLEEDMIKEQYYDETYPVRAFIDDIQYSKEPLPNRARRLVFVKDRAGYTAPRGAKLLCRYDNDTGFYEPISKQTYFVFGTVLGGNNAVVDLSYIQGKHRGSNTPTMNIVFDNSRFQFDIIANSKGMFYYENGAWILVSSKQPSVPR